MKSTGIALRVALGLLFTFLGGAQFGLGGAVFGCILGIMAAEIFNLHNRLAQLEKKAIEVNGAQDIEEEVTFSPSDLAEPAKPQKLPRKVLTPRKPKQPVTPEPGFVDKVYEGIGSQADVISKQTIGFFTSGNLVLKVGLIILFFGFSFLIKYAAQRNMLPIEIRLIAVTICGIALLTIGWKLRIKKRAYGLILQGGGVGVLYLVVFGAAKLYGFLPLTLAFGVMVGIVALSGCLAVIQNSMGLAVFGIIGGFLAPVLMSSGEGNHVLLFSYFGLLNCGIFAIAWFQSWRLLNLIGFIFTFGIGTVWGREGYQPLFFSSTEPFLVVYFLFYLIISVLFAYRQPINLRGYIDGPLVFGLPLVVSGLQYWLVKDMQYGMAFSALFLGLVYLSLSTILIRRKVKSMGLLAECFLAIGVVFASLAIPLALDGQWSTAIWALEGGGMVWVGVRQKRVYARLFGLLLQFGAAFLFVDSVWYPFNGVPFLNYYFLGYLFLAAAAIFSSYCLENLLTERKYYEKYMVTPLLIYGLLWWYIGGLYETEKHMAGYGALNGFLLYCSVSSILMGIVLRRVEWFRIFHLLKLQLPMMVFLLPLCLSKQGVDQHLLGGYGLAAWLVALVVQHRILFLYAENWHPRFQEIFHVATFYLVLYLLSHETAWLIKTGTGLTGVWPVICWAIIPVLGLLMIIHLEKTISWPFGEFSNYYLGRGSLFLIAYLVLWILYSLSLAGNPTPLPYLPVLNPLELTAIFVLIGLSVLAVLDKKQKLFDQKTDENILFIAIGLLLFLLLNSTVARTVHVYSGVPYRPEPLFNSVVLHAALSALWGIGSLSITAYATRRGNRVLWAIGAFLLALVVVKLFLIDLSSTGTVARIVSFLVVGVLMLIIGYVSPIPSKNEEKE